MNKILKILFLTKVKILMNLDCVLKSEILQVHLVSMIEFSVPMTGFITLTYDCQPLAADWCKKGCHGDKLKYRSTSPKAMVCLSG